jgi:hypothetical protein
VWQRIRPEIATLRSQRLFGVGLPRRYTPRNDKRRVVFSAPSFLSSPLKGKEYRLADYPSQIHSPRKDSGQLCGEGTPVSWYGTRFDSLKAHSVRLCGVGFFVALLPSTIAQDRLSSMTMGICRKRSAVNIEILISKY